MKTIQQFSLLLLLAALFASCSSNSFKIDGEITNLKGSSLKVVFLGDSGVIDEWVNVDKKGHFSFKGASSQPTLLNMSNHRGDPVATMIVTNGDHMKVKGDADKAMGVKIKGNRLNEEWQLFREEHAAFYSDPNPSRLDATIEKYVREHPADMLSTVLLVADYSDFSNRGKVDKMLQSIAPEAKPKSLTRVLIGNRIGNPNANLPRLMSLTLFKHGGNFEDVALTGHSTLISFWANPQNDRKTLVAELKALLGTRRTSRTRYPIIGHLFHALVRHHRLYWTRPLFRPQSHNRPGLHPLILIRQGVSSSIGMGFAD